MMTFLADNLYMLWLALSIICLIMELSSGDFYITCFAIGGLFSALGAAIGLPLWAQVLVWVVASVLCVRLLRPRLVARLHKGTDERQSNADALIGRVGTVVEAIEANGSGYVQVDGDQWRAITAGGATLPKGAKARIVARESIVVTVEPAE